MLRVEQDYVNRHIARETKSLIIAFATRTCAGFDFGGKRINFYNDFSAAIV